MKRTLTTLFAATLTLAGCANTSLPKLNVLESTESQFQLPAYEQHTLDNGLTVYLMPDAEVPLINVRAVVRAGAVNDTTAGLAAMTADGLSFGAGDRTKLEIEQATDFVGAQISTGASLEGSYVASSFLKQNRDLMLPIISDMLMDPRFDQGEFDKAKTRGLAALQQAKESPRAVINQYLMSASYPGHPYGNPVNGEQKSLGDMSVSQLRAFHQSYYQPQNTAIVVTGDFEPRGMLADIKGLFEPWSNGEAITQPTLTGGQESLDSSKVLLVDKPDSRETTFVIAGAGVARDNPDYVALTVINTVLGGRFTSWLNDELRVNSGLTYGARSAFVPMSQSGVFRISTFTATETSKEAIDLALSTYARLWEQGLDQATLDSAKAYVKGQFPPRYETAQQRADFLGNMFLYGYDESFINDFESKVNGLTLERSRELIAQYFPKDNYRFVMIGKADDIRELAASYGEVAEVSITDSGFAR
ncbi:M16 family metallopeptidase [Paraferrimonas sedimenticola]|uniref:Peptidase M16 n=1 Tax=Paraferrimonas sedimenticola TaxID=375674 RepID=A0AA37RYU0_9GAMM|nr:pitrilysin family protein [Paraferrimonas sedimenticola]GLP97834.1 peptidase M16 [Paraferrimonas sedimenticola]